MVVRQLSSGDATAYQTLRLCGLRENPTAFSASYEDEAGWTLDQVSARVTPAPDGSVCVFGVFVDETLAGLLACLHPQRAKIRHCVDLAGMYVAPDYRRRGLGHALLRAAIAHAQNLDGVTQLRLAVNAANTAARLLYISAGFTRFGTQPEALHVDGVYYDEESYILRFNEPRDESRQTTTR